MEAYERADYGPIKYNAHYLRCRGHCPAYRGHMPGFRWSSRRSLSCAALCLLFGCLQLPLGEAVTPLTSWQSGIATNYGGPLDGKNPYDPSWGTITVCLLPMKCFAGIARYFLLSDFAPPSNGEEAASTVTYLGMLCCY